jgi:hypothetical protein
MTTEEAATVAPISLSVITQKTGFCKCEHDVSVNTTRAHRIVTVKINSFLNLTLEEKEQGWDG